MSEQTTAANLDKVIETQMKQSESAWTRKTDGINYKQSRSSVFLANMNFELYFSKILFSLYTEIKYEISLFYLKIFFTFCLFCPLLFFSQLHLIPCASPPFILQRRIMLLRRIDITVSQNIRDEVNIAGFTVQISAVGAAELMWRDLF